MYITVTYGISYSAWYHWYHNIMSWILFLSCGNILLSFPGFYISYIFCFLLINSIKIPPWWIDFDVCHCWRVKKNTLSFYFEIPVCFPVSMATWQDFTRSFVIYWLQPSELSRETNIWFNLSLTQLHFHVSLSYYQTNSFTTGPQKHTAEANKAETSSKIQITSQFLHWLS